MIYLLIILLVVAAGWQIAGRLLARKAIFPTFAVPGLTINPDPGIAELVKLAIPTEAGSTEAWFVPGEGVSAANPGPVVIYAHGNAEVIDPWPVVLAPYRAMGVSLMLIEYRGYGRSDGKPSQKAITRDFVAGYDMLLEREDVDPGRIFFHGRSLGGGVVCSLARHRRPAALILQSTFTSAGAIAMRFGVLPFMLPDRFNTKSFIAQYDGPVMILHGERDSIIPYRHGQALAAAAPQAVLHTYGCDHNDFPVNSVRYWRDIRVFVVEAGLTASPD